MEVDDIIRAFGTGSQTLRRESLRLANVTRQAGRTIGNGAGGTGDIEGKAAMGSGE